MHCFEVAMVICAFKGSHASPNTNLDNDSYVTLLLDGTRIGLCYKYYSFLIPNVDECVKHSSKG
jgi:hypothetical protein